MPIYEERCLACGIEFEALILAKAHEELVDCPRCHSKNLERLVSMPTIRVAVPKFEMKRGPAHNPFQNLTLQHVRDEHGKPIKVNSESELRAAEKKYGFVHHASHCLTRDSLDTPPQHESWAGDVRHGYEWKWTPPEQRDDMSGVSAGPVTHDKLLVPKVAEVGA